MRSSGLFCALGVAIGAIGAIGATGCAGRTQPYRFSSPLLGAADVPPAFSARPGDPDAPWRRPPSDGTVTVENGIHLSPRTPGEDRRPGAIRVASAQAAADVAAHAAAHGVEWMRLPAMQRLDSTAPKPPLHEPSDLRALVGRRDLRDSVTAALAWSAELGAPIELDLSEPDLPPHASWRTQLAAAIEASREHTGRLLAWAFEHGRTSDDIEPGSLLVFARTESETAPDLVAIAVGRDGRGVVEFVFCAGGAIRRGFFDLRHPSRRRDADGAIENTFLRTGKRWPPSGTHYLAGELFVRARSIPADRPAPGQCSAVDVRGEHYGRGMARAKTWTDDELRAAVAASTSFKMTMSRLGLVASGVGYYDIKARIRELELDTTHFVRRRRAAYAWTDAQLRSALDGARSRLEVLQRLHVPATAQTLRALARHRAELGLAAPEVSGRTHAGRRWTDDELRTAVARSRSLAGVLRALGLVPAGGNYQHVQRRIRALALDVSHLSGRAWSRGVVLGPRPRVPLDQVLVAGRWTSTQALKQRLLRAGLKQPACEMCGWAQRSADGRLPLELDHINGERDDNRLENLRVLCPNCHSLQPTHRGSNKRRGVGRERAWRNRYTRES